MFFLSRASSMSTASRTTILFHGNCIDGWFSAYFAYCNLQDSGVQMFPIAPSQPNTWPSAETMAGTDIWLLDVSVPEQARNEWIAAGALRIQCIDHHATAIEQWPTECCPIHTDCCAALQTFRHFYPDAEVPSWLHSIDRVDRWVDVTYEDRCLREFLHDIARLPVQQQTSKAIEMTNEFLENMEHRPETYPQYVEQGKQCLIHKDEELMRIIDSLGQPTVVDEELAAKWKLPSTWLGHTLFLMDTTDVILDTTEAAHLVFTKHPEIAVFINFRNKIFYTKRRYGTMKSMVVYSARSAVSHGLDLTKGSIFRGHPTSAGASLVRGEASHFPFL